MKIKGFIVALLTVFFFAGTALAGGPATMKTDVPTIPEADCDQAGWISLEVLGGFDLHEGDQIVWSTTNNVPLCKDIDLFMSIADVASNNYPTRTDAAIFVTNAADTLELTGTDVGATIASPNGSTWEMGFLIRGTAGSNRITLIVTRRWQTVNAADNPWVAGTNETGNYVGLIGVGQDAGGIAIGTPDLIMTFNTAAGAPTDIMTIRLFDSNNEAFLSDTNAGWFEKDTVAPYGYIDGIEPEDNVLCLDTNNDATLVNGQYVWATPDSQPGTVAGSSQVSFSGDYTIANISGSEGYTTTTVAKGVCETFSIGTELDQFGNPISDFVTIDVGSYNDAAAGLAPANRWSDQSGTCEEGDGFGVLVSKSSIFGSAEQYGITVSLAVSADGGSTYTDAASDAAWFLAAPIVYETNASALGNVQGAADPAVVSNAVAVAQTETIDTVVYTYGYDYPYFNVIDIMNDAFMIDVSSVRIDKAAFAAGEILALKVELRKFPCGEVEEAYICLGTAVENCPTSGTSFSRYFPYGVGAENAAFWTGIAITNRSDSDGTATVTFYGTEGGMSTYTIDVAARDIETFAMSAIMDDLVGDLTGAENFQAEVSTDFIVDGIMFIGGKGTNAVLHGYLPR